MSLSRPRLIWGVVAFCGVPMMLILFGADFGSAKVPLDAQTLSRTEKSVGVEIDATITITLNRYANTTLGYSHLFPGKFIRQSGPVSHVNFAYVI